ncbi:hypothetical protein [Fibrobacter sp. UWB5]|nr:hypothetical protein [Fibrobacter sp. UWB5]OWV13253.1 hypothetical protein B7989_05045 [Fibrobacter sp. UWB5]
MAFTEEELNAMSDEELQKEFETIGRYLKQHHVDAEKNRKVPMDRKKMIEQIQHHQSIQRMTKNRCDVGSEIIKRTSK